MRNDAFLDPDLDRFNEALKDYLAAGWRGFKVTPRDGADKNAPEGPRPQDRPPADTADDHSASDDDGTEGTEPALPFGEDRGAA